MGQEEQEQGMHHDFRQMCCSAWAFLFLFPYHCWGKRIALAPGIFILL